MSIKSDLNRLRQNMPPIKPTTPMSREDILAEEGFNGFEILQALELIDEMIVDFPTLGFLPRMAAYLRGWNVSGSKLDAARGFMNEARKAFGVEPTYATYTTDEFEAKLAETAAARAANTAVV